MKYCELILNNQPMSQLTLGAIPLSGHYILDRESSGLLGSIRDYASVFDVPAKILRQGQPTK